MGHVKIFKNSAFESINIAPVFTSSSTASAIDENTASSTVIYTATGTDESAITWSLKMNMILPSFL